ncbi:polyprenyl synthetase family protein [Nocardiopsis kunsanensis]|uniref:polyprenyl synthetase family protein n=1 Tax=Nocardiopsis kunsanensis TaxID=141693 RepID=UPI00034B328A
MHREETRAAVDRLLGRTLDELVSAVRGLDADCAADLVVPLADFARGGGRRMRSVLAWWGWTVGGGAAEGHLGGAALRACAALELLHCFALIHDDIMDRAEHRRGAPSCHVAHARAHRDRGLLGDPDRHGISMAVLAGDLALVRADDLVAEALEELPGAREARGVWRQMRTEMVVGQFLDLNAQAQGSRNAEAALRIDRLKTASYTVERPLHLGAAMAGAPDGTVAALRSYGAVVGVAFQLRDDLRDVFGTTGTTGRPGGEDLREGKTTLLLAMGTELAERQGDRRAIETLRAVGHEGAPVAEAARALERVGAREHVEHRCAELAGSGIAHLDRIGLPPAVRAGLDEFARAAGTP